MANSQPVGIKPLQIWQEHGLTAEDVQRIKQAKQSLGLPYTVQLARAVPEGESRVLALETPPPFICDYFMVESTLDANLRDAVEWVLGERGDDFRIVTMTEMLEETLGGPVMEVEDANELGRPADVDDYWGIRGPIDPNLSSEREYRSAIRKTVGAAA